MKECWENRKKKEKAINSFLVCEMMKSNSFKAYTSGFLLGGDPVLQKEDLELLRSLASFKVCSFEVVSFFQKFPLWVVSFF